MADLILTGDARKLDCPWKPKCTGDRCMAWKKQTDLEQPNQLMTEDQYNTWREKQKPEPTGYGWCKLIDKEV